MASPTAQQMSPPSAKTRPVDLAIIIVSWNVKELLAACLRSVAADLAQSDFSAKVWVVDNASGDGSAEIVRRDFPEVKLIASDENLGFAGGNNAALRAIGFETSRNDLPLPDAVLLLNPDTVIHAGALQAVVNFLQHHPQVGVAGTRLIYGDGTFQHSAFAFPGLWQLAIELLPLPGRLVESRLNGRYPREMYERGEPFAIGHPLGAAMAVRREAIQQVGLLDERYQMYVEEVDWSKRIVAAGWAAYCVPDAVITHYGGQSSGQVKMGSLLNLWRSRYQFYRKHYTPPTVWLARQIVRAGMGRRMRQAIEAAQADRLNQAELAERLAGYEKVIQIWKGEA